MNEVKWETPKVETIEAKELLEQLQFACLTL